MNNICDIAPEKLPFEMFGLCLQEPMALITNWIIAATAFVIFFRIKTVNNDFQKYWKYFYFAFGLSTFFGGLGHLFFYYFELLGKVPSWSFGIISAFFAGKAMLSIEYISEKQRKFWTFFLYFKAITFGFLALTKGSFIFVLVDAVITYLSFCLGLGLYYWGKGLKSFKYTVLAVIILFPSVFIFLLQINPHIWFNKDDLSHVLMATTILFFYIGIVKLEEYQIDGLNVAPKKNNISKI